jgi:hypothetical protein
VRAANAPDAFCRVRSLRVGFASRGAYWEIASDMPSSTVHIPMNSSQV